MLLYLQQVHFSACLNLLLKLCRILISRKSQHNYIHTWPTALCFQIPAAVLAFLELYGLPSTRLYISVIIQNTRTDFTTLTIKKC